MNAISAFNNGTVVIAGFRLSLFVAGLTIGIIDFTITAVAHIPRLVLTQKVTNFAGRQPVITNLSNSIAVITSLISTPVQVPITAICFCAIRIAGRCITSLIAKLIAFYSSIAAIKNLTRYFSTIWPANRARRLTIITSL